MSINTESQSARVAAETPSAASAVRSTCVFVPATAASPLCYAPGDACACAIVQTGNDVVQASASAPNSEGVELSRFGLTTDGRRSADRWLGSVSKAR